jgi:hypothetical protein
LFAEAGRIDVSELASQVHATPSRLTDDRNTATMTSPPPLRSARTGDGVTLAWTALGVGPPLIWMPSMGNLVAQWRVPTLRRAYERLAG